MTTMGVVANVAVLVGLCACIAAARAAHNATTVEITSVRGGRPSHAHPGVTLDWWVRDDKKYGYQWGDAGILTLDLESRSLRVLARALAPGLLRLGGSPIDSMVYQFGEHEQCARGAGTTAGGSAHFRCSQVGVATYGCLTPHRWRSLLSFAADTGLRLVLGLNACRGRTGADAPMDFSNIQELLSFTASLPAHELTGLHGFEFGNEVCGWGVGWERWAIDMAELRARVHATFVDGAGLPMPQLIGPDCAFDDAGYARILKNMTAEGDFLAAMTYHQYPQCEPVAGSRFVLEPACLQKLDTQAAQAVQVLRDAGVADKTEAWSGESADHTASGGDFGHHLLPTFRSSFYYAWQLSALPLHGVTLAARQCLIGGNYGLLNHTTFQPNPDFFIAYTYRALFDRVLRGNAVALQTRLSQTASAGAQTDGLRTFAFTDAAAAAAAADDSDRTVLVVINMDMHATASLRVSGPVARRERRELHFTARQLTDTVVFVNGELLEYKPASGQLPDILDMAVAVSASDAITVQPASIVFVVL